jgi:hypothetical protein
VNPRELKAGQVFDGFRLIELLPLGGWRASGALRATVLTCQWTAAAAG